MIKPLSTASVLALSLAAGPAMADSLLGLSGGADVNVGVNANASLGQQFKTLDRDGDGVITRSEAAANAELASRFQAMDGDDNGSLSQGEFSAGLKARADAAGKSAGERMKSTMQSGKEMAGDAAAKTEAGLKAGAEATGDAAREAAAKAKAGAEASAEAATSAAEKAKASMQAGGDATAKATANLSNELAGQFKALDANRDGRISEAEAEGNADIAGNFSAADENNDGLLTGAEFKVAAKAKADGGFFSNLFGG